MALDIQISGATPEQIQEVGEAFSAVITNGRPEGISNSLWAKKCILGFIRNVVVEHRKKPLEAQLKNHVQQVAADYADA